MEIDFQNRWMVRQTAQRSRQCKYPTKPYGKRLEGLSIPFGIQQSSDTMSDEGATWPWMANCAGCVLHPRSMQGTLSLSYRCT